jgi:hypothetical protein
MDISDYVNGSAYISLCRSDFKSDYTFDSYCRFMRQPESSDFLKVYVIYGEPEPEINQYDPDEPSEFEEIE